MFWSEQLNESFSTVSSIRQGGKWLAMAGTNYNHSELITTVRKIIIHAQEYSIA